MMITIYVDMDQVLANFDKDIVNYNYGTWCDDAFIRAVKDHGIFAHLDPMPSAVELMNFVKEIPNVNIEILSSIGLKNNPTHATRAANQKKFWLRKNGWGHYKANFVESFPEKGLYGNSRSILIDDRRDCIEAFEANGGIGILHVDSNLEHTKDLLLAAIYKLNMEG